MGCLLDPARLGAYTRLRAHPTENLSLFASGSYLLDRRTYERDYLVLGGLEWRFDI